MSQEKQFEQEIWKDVRGYEERYQVSNLGRVKSLERYVKHWRGGVLLKKEKILSQSKIRGYCVVRLYKDGGGKMVYVHRLVGKCFVYNSNPNIFDQINHIDANKSNNFYKNLEWCDHEYNQRHINNLGLKKYSKGQSHYCAKINEKDVIKIRTECLSSNMSQREIGLKYGLKQGTISDIYRKKIWKHV